MEGGVVFKRFGLPYFQLLCATAYDPLAHHDQLGYRLDATGRQLELGDLLSALKDPDAAIDVLAPDTRPSCEDDLLPCYRRGDLVRRLWPGYEDEVQSALQVVRLQRAPDRGGDLEGGFAEWEGREGDAGG